MGQGGVIGQPNRPSTSGDVGIWQNWNPSSNLFTQQSFDISSRHASGVWDLASVAQFTGNNQWPVPVESMVHLFNAKSSVFSGISLNLTNIPQDYNHLYMLIDTVGDAGSFHTTTNFWYHPLSLTLFNTTTATGSSLTGGRTRFWIRYWSKEGGNNYQEFSDLSTNQSPHPIGVIAPINWANQIGSQFAGYGLTSLTELWLMNYSKTDFDSVRSIFSTSFGIGSYTGWPQTAYPIFHSTTYGDAGASSIQSLTFRTFNNGGTTGNDPIMVRVAAFGVK